MKDNILKSSDSYDLLWDLKNFPLTEQLGKFSTKTPHFDQQLLISKRNGQVFLGNIVPTNDLYTENDYTYRTETSFASIKNISVFESFFHEVIKSKQISSLIDVGGNDLGLAKKLKHLSNKTYVIDPINSSIDGETVDGIKVIGKMTEEINFSDLKPDVIVSRHTLEHIEDPKKVIKQWFEECPEECVYIAEIPDFDCLVESMRFDAIFHQHISYFTLETLTNLIEDSGGEVLKHKYNYQGSCGGALLIAFKKAKGTNKTTNDFKIIDKINYIKKRLHNYENNMKIFGEIFNDLPKPIYGYGAGLMLATLGYHLRTDFKNIECILDDDKNKDEITYKNVDVRVRHTEKVNPEPNSSYLITSLENIRPIFSRIATLNPRRVISPIIS